MNFGSLSEQDDRQRQQEKLADEVESIKQQMAEHKAVLPEKYVLREDYIRGQAVLEAKMDAVYKTLNDLYKMERNKS